MHLQDRQRLYWRLAALALGLAAAPLLAVALYDSRGAGDVQIAAGWVLVVISVGLLVVVLRRRVAGSLGFLAVCVLSMYHGVSGVSFALFPGGAAYRAVAGVSEWAAAQAALDAGLGIFALTLAYLSTVRRPSAITPSDERARKIEAQLRRVSLRALLTWSAIAILYRSGIDTLLAGLPGAAYWSSALTTYLLLPLVVLTVLRMAVAVRAGEMTRRRALLYGSAITLAMVLLVTRRQDVMVGSLAVLVLAAKWRLGTPRKRTLVAAGCVILTLFIVLAMLRAEVGRAALTHSALTDRIGIVANGLGDVFTHDAAREGGMRMAARDVGYRLDANTFLAAMIQARARRVDAVDLAPFTITAAYMVPSAVWSAKLTRNDASVRTAKGYFRETRTLGEADYLATPLAIFYASGGLPFMLALMALMGITLGLLDRSVTRRARLVMIVCTACVAVALGQAEQDIMAWGLAARNAVILSLALTLLALRFRRGWQAR